MGTFLEEHLDALVTGLLAALIIARKSRQNRFLKELILREKESAFEHYNKIVKTLSTTFSRGPTPTLRDLAEDTDGDFRVK